MKCPISEPQGIARRRESFLIPRPNLSPTPNGRIDFRAGKNFDAPGTETLVAR
jgi:hypothetical protein